MGYTARMVGVCKKRLWGGISYRDNGSVQEEVLVLGYGTEMTFNYQDKAKIGKNSVSLPFFV